MYHVGYHKGHQPSSIREPPGDSATSITVQHRLGSGCWPRRGRRWLWYSGAGGAAHVGKRAYDGGDAGGASQRRRLGNGDVGGRSRSGGMRYGCGSRSVRREGGDAGGADDVGGSRGSSSSGVPTTFIVPPGARPWLECPRCLTLCASADAFVDHACNPPSPRVKGSARPADRREPAR